MTTRHYDKYDELKRHFAVSFFCSLPLTYLVIGQFAKWPLPRLFADPQNTLFLALAQLGLILPIVIVNRDCFSKGLSALVRGTPDKNSLIATGATACLGFSLYAITGILYGFIFMNPEIISHYSASLYFESAAVLLTLISLEALLADRAEGQISGVIEQLQKLQPESARVFRNGIESRQPIEKLLPGDNIIINPGQQIPVDGVIIEGKTLIDASAITGVHIPAPKIPGDRVWSATVNLSSTFTLRAERVGPDTILSNLIQLVKKADALKKPIPPISDRVGRRFIPVIFLSALATAVVWLIDGATPEFIFANTIAVLVIACPVAMGLAIPIAILVGTSVGARNGIRIKNPRALHFAHTVDTVIIEKTGIITAGRPSVTDIISVSDLDHNELLTLAASLEKLSEHPLGAVITEEAEKSGLILSAVEDFQGVPGKGVTGTIRGHRYFGGSPAYLLENGISVDELEPNVARLAVMGKIPFCFGGEGKQLGLIAVADVIKPGSLEAIGALQSMGIEVIMMTGDNPRTAEGMRRATGIPRILAEMMPEAKADFIHKLQTEGRTVAMIGDGINDVAAIVSADIGIAMLRGTAISQDAADVILLRNDLREAVTVVRLGRKVINNIQENLVWAVVYNTLGIPLAAGLFYSRFGWKLTPLIATAVMLASSLSMILNALRLNFFRKGT